MNLDLLKKKLTDFLEKTPYELYDVEYIPNKRSYLEGVYRFGKRNNDG